MAATISFFRVDNGDMTLLTLQSDKRVLIDCNIRITADDPDADTPDVAKQLRDRLLRDSSGRPYVDAMVLSHPDADHCRGLKKHFHLGPIADYPSTGDKIVVKQMWSSPIVFRRTGKDHVLCEDADAWATEARRRVKRFEELGYGLENERILILGEDVHGKTDNLGTILLKADQVTNSIGESWEYQFEARLIAPAPAQDDEEDLLTKNNSSVVLRFKLGSGTASDACRFLTGGDADVAVWERIWSRNKVGADNLTYDLLLSPHHCSWRSLSCDSWSDLGDDAEVNAEAYHALSQTRRGAKVIASSKSINDDDSDPPCARAEREYEAIVQSVNGEFICVGDDGPEPLEFLIESGGLKPKGDKVKTFSQTISIGREPQGHGAQ
jgi:hypothetical protein